MSLSGPGRFGTFKVLLKRCIKGGQRNVVHFGLAQIEVRVLVDLLGDGVAQQQDKRVHFVH